MAAVGGSFDETPKTPKNTKNRQKGSVEMGVIYSRWKWDGACDFGVKYQALERFDAIL